VERQAWRGQAEGLRDLPGRHTSIPRSDQKPDEVKTRLMRQSRQGCEDFTSIHRSTIQEWLK
jgi:hypothetical protein